MSPLRMRMIEDMKLAGLSPGTQATYIDAVRKLAAYYRRSPDQLSEEEVRALSSTCVSAERRAAPSRRTITASSICIDTRSAAIGRCSQKKKIRLPRQKRLPRALAHAEVRRLFGCITNPIHRTCFAVMYACGLRIGEAATLEIGTIDGDNGLLRIIGKGNKERLVPLPEPMLLSLRRLWTTHKSPRWLFPTRAATNPVGRGTLNRTFAAAAQAAGIGSATPHSLRHGYATRLLQQHCHDQHLHSPDRADPRFAQKPPRQGDERPLIAVSRRDRACRRLPPVRGRLSVGPWHGDASLASPCHRRHPGLPDRGPRRTPVAL